MARAAHGYRAGNETLPRLLDGLGVPAVGSGPHGQAAWANAAARALFGGPAEGGPAELMRAWGTWYDADRSPLRGADMPLARVMAGNVLRDLEVMVKPVRAAPRFFLASGRPLGEPGPAGAESVVVLREVTARRRMTQISRCQARVGELLSEPAPVDALLPEVVATIGSALEWAAAEYWTVDGVAGVLRRRFGWDPRDLVPPELPPHLRCDEGLAGRAWRTGGPLWVPDLRARPDSADVAGTAVDWATLRAGLAVPVPSGRTILAIMVLYSDSPEDSGDTRAALLPGIASMIGQFLERRRAERLDTELDESRGEYVNLVSHEVRTPLAVIESYADLLAADPHLGGDQAELLAVMRRSAKSMHAMVDKLLDMAALRAGDRTVDRAPVNLTALCRDAAAAARAAGADVEVDAPADDLIVDGDAARLRRVLDELLPAGGGDAHRVELRLRADGPTITVSRDRPAVPPDAPGAGVPGTALGFTLIRAIVEAHHGHLTADDGSGAVASYTIRLPGRDAAGPPAS
ncbi:hypothetical protein GCM10010123_16130 [Pilimelia anulata]|uniref:histidine kinase n=1 Tax=Pilimelia anulata TaxID=53371 RepID=A0A8J3F8B4_9ACTN|nr:GAF domain-containing sensor histidine kinase [Pilimelia anulata]GGJ87321.1 hypothetical protein GCM10010123_16130 [Pilimelia anulata]